MTNARPAEYLMSLVCELLRTAPRRLILIRVSFVQ